MKRFQYEKKIIDPILKVIKNNQEYLTMEENLPQLAKLGFIYNTLFYQGRICYGYEGLIYKSRRGDCEDNPKYQLEDCEPINDEIDNLIYDAWGMHCRSDDIYKFSTVDEFKKLILDSNKEYSEFELLNLKQNKTLDDWIMIFQHPDYPYIKYTYRQVINFLLCTIGTGFEYNKENGLIFYTASGADIDITRYGKWENAIFHPSIKKVIEKILSYEELEKVFEYSYLIGKKYELIDKYKYFMLNDEAVKIIEYLNSQKLVPLDELNNYSSKLFKLQKDHDDMIKETLKLVGKKVDLTPVVNYQKYYPISNYSIIYHLDEKSHPSYLKAGIKICNDIIKNKNEEYPENVKFAETFLKRFNNE